ncbi:DNA-binding protein [Marinobacter sp.]|uniref:DNA-binding protein n=1 Tax=Marinobacter sp. TaxID=50741 RepID=UPI0035628412
MFITEQEVHVACFEILKEGRFPTHSSIRKTLGDRGSNSTISKYLTSWRERLDGNYDNPAFSDVPKSLKNPIDNFWQSAINVARERLENDLGQLSAENSTIKAELRVKAQKNEELEKSISELKENNQRLTDNNSHLVNTTNKLQEEIDNLTNENRELIAIHNQLQDRNISLNEQIESLELRVNTSEDEIRNQNHHAQEVLQQTACLLRRLSDQKIDISEISYVESSE